MNRLIYVMGLSALLGGCACAPKTVQPATQTSTEQTEAMVKPAPTSCAEGGWDAVIDLAGQIGAVVR